MQNLINVKCLNPNCNNRFDIYQSSYDKKKKLYCCRKCRSEHHWLITPLYEKPCLSCGTPMKRKFIQKLDRLKYCSPICRTEHKTKIFQEKLKDTIKSNCRVCNIELVVNREPCGKLIPRKICDKCNRKENQLKTKKMTKRFIELYSNDENFKNKMKVVNERKGIKAKLKHQKEGLPSAWVEWYKKFAYFGKSKIEDKVFEFLKNKVSGVERSYPISNIFVDIYIPEKNLIIECHGDYWHMKPEKFKPDDYNKSTKKTARQQWEKDKNRKTFLENQGYKVVELWETEINQGDYKKLDIYI